MSVIAPGSRVLVTGANGYIPSFICLELLAAGFRVRGTSRKLEHIQWLVDLCEQRYPGRFEAIAVPDISVEGAFDNALDGVSGVIQSAFDNSFQPDTKIVDAMVQSMKHLLESCAKRPDVKAVVFTSSVIASYFPQPGVRFTVTEDTWNDACIQLCKEKPDPFNVYGTGKVECERLLLKHTEAGRLHVASVLPGFNFGPIIKPGGKEASSTTSWAVRYWDGDTSVRSMPSQVFVDVEDTAKLHVAALTDPEAHRLRVFACAEPTSWNKVGSIFRKLYPEHPVPEDDKDEAEDVCTLPTEFAESLLKRHYNQGWTSLEESLKQIVFTLAA